MQRMNEYDRAAASVDGIPPPRSASKKAPRLSVTWARDIAPHLSGRYIVKGLLPSDSLIHVIGAPNCGKSAVTIDIACHVGSRRNWRGRRVRGGPVAYFALEARQSVENRVEAWCRHHGAAREDVHLAIFGGTLNLRDPASVAEAIRLLQEQACAHGDFVLIVIDTQARATPGAKENSAEDMSAAIGACDRIRAEIGASLILVHHAGKDPTQGARGHSSQTGAVDVSLEVADRCIKQTKVRDDGAGAPIPFDLLPIELGEDEDGDAVTGVVAIEGAGNSRATSKPPTGHAANALRAFDDLITEGKGHTSPGTSVVPKGGRYLMIDDWRGRFLRYLGDERDDATASRSAWRDAKKVLTSRRLILIDGQIAWKP